MYMYTVAYETPHFILFILYFLGDHVIWHIVAIYVYIWGSSIVTLFNFYMLIMCMDKWYMYVSRLAKYVKGDNFFFNTWTL